MAQLFLLDTPVSETEREQLKTQAHERGYKTVGEYLLALAKADAQLTSVDDESDDEVNVVSQLRHALEDVKAGRIYPYDKLREMIEDDETSD
ncbi:MAG: hypothetical protein LCI00_15885 [Chloroflexi bacterium]|nr:hypothetical protein [Chloroflexota bacterium]MCC6892711.1 hypothetical protein [Anaerolineae bacterium]